MLPSKKVLSLFILATALVASIIIVFGKDKSSQAINYASNLVAGEKVTVPENPNWQNELNGVSTLTKTVATSTEVATTPETVTDTVSKSLLSNYLVLKQNGTLDQTSAQNLVDQTAKYAEGSNSPKIVRASDLKIIADNGKQSIADYGENLGTILKNNKSSQSQNEISIVKEAINTKDPNKLDELQEEIDIYKKFADDLIKMPIPQTFIKAHIDTVNGIFTIVFGLEEIKHVLADPIRGLVGLQKYEQGGTLFLDAVQASSEFINKNSITYKQGSGGYYLMYGI